MKDILSQGTKLVVYDMDNGASSDDDRAADPTGSNPQARFWSKVKVTDECWPWQGGIDADGYGRFYPARRPVRAHRYMFEMTNGPIGEGLVIDHLCRNRCCVNPEHLRATTCRANVLENSEGLAQANAARTHCAKGHPLSGDNLSVTSGQRRCKQCQRDRWHANNGAAKRRERRSV